MSKWRPEDWEETKMMGFKIYYENEPFEAGADAMLEALSKEADKIYEVGQDGYKLVIPLNGKKLAGKLVFIPDEEQDADKTKV